MGITVMTMDIFLKSDGRKTVNDLNSNDSTFKYQLHQTFRSIFTPTEYQGLYGGVIPGPQTLPNVVETSVSLKLYCY